MNYIVELIIRPARNLYQAKDLGEKVFFYVGQMKSFNFVRQYGRLKEDTSLLR